MAFQLTQALREEYRVLFAKMTLRPERMQEIDAIHRRVRAPHAIQAYAAIESKIGVPWFVVAIMHNLEASLRFDRHLHNGDPLTAKTVRVPKNRPATGSPPFTWPDSAADALALKKLDQWTDWSVEGIAFVLERFNGTGYRNNFPHVKSPYLWSFSNIYTRGKYIRDHVFSEDAVSQQCGGMVLLRYLMDNDAQIAARVGFGPPPADDDDARPFPNTEGPDGTDVPPIVTPPAGTIPKFPGGYLRRGMMDSPVVRILQRRLRELGADPGTYDGDFADVTEWAVKLFQARSADIAGEPLEIDGVVGPKTWGAMFGPGSVTQPGPMGPVPQTGTFIASVLEIAGQQVGVREVPLGSNRGPQVDQFIRSVGLDPTDDSYPWCMCFVYWCFLQAAQRHNTTTRVPKTGGVHRAWELSQNMSAPVRIVTAAEARRDPSLVVPGMAFFIDTGGRKGHTGIIAENINASMETIEGNTTDVSGSREGIGVFRRNRRKVFDINLGFAAFS